LNLRICREYRENKKKGKQNSAIVLEIIHDFKSIG